MWEQKLRKNVNRGLDGTPPFGTEKVAAALLLLRQKPHEVDFEILLTKRTLKVHNHRGQISLPGGFPEDGDKNWQDTALRETQEEIGLTQDQIELWGEFRCVETKLGVKIVVYLGVLRGEAPLWINPDEVEKVLFLPSQILLNDGFTRMIVEDSGISISTIGLAWQGELIWGATARVLDSVQKILKEPA